MSVVGPSIPVYESYPDAPPAVVGSITGAAGDVTIEVWNMEDGSAVALAAGADACVAIGDTEKFSWSLGNLPRPTKTREQYHYRMTDQNGLTDEGDFIIQVIEGLSHMPSLLEPDSYIVRF